MTALKAHLVADFLVKPDLKNGIFLAYGPDQGLVSETARRLMKFFAGKDADPMSEITFDANELAADPSKLAVEARTISMFGGTRRIRVRGAGKALTTTLSEMLVSGELTAGHARTLITANDPLAMARKIVREGLSVRQAEALHQDNEAPKSAKVVKVKDTDTVSLEKRLTDSLGLGVSISHKKKGGRLEIRYKTLEQLDDVCQKLSNL